MTETDRNVPAEATRTEIIRFNVLKHGILSRPIRCCRGRTLTNTGRSWRRWRSAWLAERPGGFYNAPRSRWGGLFGSGNE